MKEGDLVMVEWPTGRGGPYEVSYCDGVNVFIGWEDSEISIPIEWTEVVPF